LFHIDFGFVLGQDPKPVDKPEMRITPEMMDALGGQESMAYRRFKELSSRIYNCLRRHINLFVIMLRLLVEAEPPIKENGVISESQLMREIHRRFIPGESYEEAEIHLCNHIEQSTSRTLTYDLLDWLHTQATGASAPSPINGSAGASGTSSGASTVVNKLWKVVGKGTRPP
jgi:phosphatidylinositol 3-kinase